MADVFKFKSEETIQKIKHIESPPQVLKDCFSTEEMANIQKIKQNCLEYGQAHGRSTRPDGRKNVLYFFKPDEKEYLIQVITTKLQKLFGHNNFYIPRIHLFRVEIPFGIHADGSHLDELAYKQLVIPLEINPMPLETYLILMNQRIYYAGECPPNLIKKPITFHNKQIYDRVNKVSGYTNQHEIDDSLIKKYWGDDYYLKDWLKGFTIQLAYKWHIGDILAFDSSTVHAASNFIQDGVQHKVGISVGLNYRDIL